MTPVLVRRALALLAADGPIAVAPAALAGAVAPHAALASEGVLAAGGLCSFLGERVDPGIRRARLEALTARLRPEAPLVVLDHNQPRRGWGRLVGASLLALRGLPPGRARHPTARELVACGFVVSSLRLACAERVQLVLAHLRPG